MIDNPESAESRADKDEATRRTTVGSLVMTAVGRSMTGQTSIYMFATAVVLPVGVISTIITIHYLRAAQYGELGLLMVLASFMTMTYNIGILHGTFLWVYGTSGDTGDDAIEAVGQTDVASQRRALTTGLVIAIGISVVGTVVFFTFSKQVASLLLGAPQDANLIALTAISGGAGAIFRLTTNVFRFERRPYAYAAATIARPVCVLIGSTGLVVAGYGVWGAVLGVAIATLVCAAGNIVATWRNYAFAFSWYDMRAIGIRTSWVLIPLIGLNVTHNGDLILLSHWVHGARLGVYRLASRLASPPSYFASAVMMAWSPLERSPTFLAAFQSRGQHVVRSFMLTYYVIAALTMVVIFSIFSHVFLLVAPGSYADAAKIVPLGSVAFLVYGLYIVVLRTVRPSPLIPWYTATTVLAAAVFIGSGFLLVPAFNVYGAPAAVTAGMFSGCVGLLLANRRQDDPLPVQYARIVTATLVAATVSAVGIAGAGAGLVPGTIAAVTAMLVYFPALVLTGAVPASHLPVLKTMIPRRGERRRGMTLAELPPAERDAIERFRNGGLEGARPTDYARLTRALRRLGGFGTATFDDARLGAYLASPDPESIRDWELRAMVDDGADAWDLSHLERLAKQVRSGRLDSERPVRSPRSALRARVRALEPRDRAELLDALAAARATNGSTAGGSREAELAQTRAVRVLRRLLGIGHASAADLALATALWRDDGRDNLAPHHRDELRWLKSGSRLATRPRDARPPNSNGTPPVADDTAETPASPQASAR